MSPAGKNPISHSFSFFFFLLDERNSKKLRAEIIIETLIGSRELEEEDLKLLLELFVWISLEHLSNRLM